MTTGADADRRVRLLELGLVAATAAVFLALPKPPAAVAPIAAFIPACIAGWATFFAIRVARDPGLVERWGLRPTAHLGPILARLGPAVAVAIGIGVGVALARDRALVPPWLWLSLLLYPVWGLVQQWLVQALLVDNVRALCRSAGRPAPLPALMALGAVGFGAIHLAHPWLVLATAGLGATYVWLFQRWPNLWPLGVAHGWLGSLFYPWVLDLNPTADLIGLLTGPGT